jgi:hypothetical protein
MINRSATEFDIITVGLVSLAAAMLAWMIGMIWGIC